MRIVEEGHLAALERICSRTIAPNAEAVDRGAAFCRAHCRTPVSRTMGAVSSKESGGPDSGSASLGAVRLYAQAAAVQWDPANAIPWDEAFELP
jgi:hypothetical protein